ncbi:MAG: hypothetical protein PHO02_01455 [Candidatus Nanoarchaeia archaeon]|nr:hypothetical protein [Candidatus Nanoarchaeia archaeon]
MDFAFVTETLKSGAAVLYSEVLSRIWLITKSVFAHPEMLWAIVPIAVSMILISYYFGKYKKEELGWNTAFGNSVVMLFACMNLYRHLHESSMLGFNSYTMLVSVIMLEGFALTLLDFLHAMPKSFAYALSSGMTVNTILIFLSIIVYGRIPMDYITALAVGVMAFAIILLMRIMQFFELASEDDGKEE